MDPRSDASPLLSFLLNNQDAFKSRGRLASLYSDFRSQRKTNPDGYNANLEAWRKAIRDAAKAGLLPGDDVLAVRIGEELLQDLELRGWGRPSCLDLVLNDALTRGDLLAMSDFLGRKECIYTTPGWSFSPWRVLPWTLRRMGILGTDTTNNDRMVNGNFVVKSIVESAATAVLETLRSTGATDMPSLIFSKSSFLTAFSNCIAPGRSVTDRDVSILLTHLSRDRNACSWDLKTGVVKFKAPHAAETTSDKCPPVTEDDISIARLKALIQTISSDVETLDIKLSQLDKEARQAVADSKIDKARSSLRSKKLILATLDKRRDTLFQLQDVYNRIVAAADNVAIVRAMEASVGVLKSLNREAGGAEKVEAVVDQLHEEMQEADDINQVLTDTAKASIGEAELDEEFEALQEAVRQQTERTKHEQKETRDEKEVEDVRKRLEELDALGTKQTQQLERAGLPSHEASKDGDKVPVQETHAG